METDAGETLDESSSGEEDEESILDPRIQVGLDVACTACYCLL